MSEKKMVKPNYEMVPEHQWNKIIAKAKHGSTLSIQFSPHGMAKIKNLRRKYEGWTISQVVDFCVLRHDKPARYKFDLILDDDAATTAQLCANVYGYSDASEWLGESLRQAIKDTRSELIKQGRIKH